MAQAIDNDNELPIGCRSNLVSALHADDPKALLKNLDACSQLERAVLLTDVGGKVVAENEWGPWSWEQANQSPVRLIDNELYRHIENNNGENLHTLLFAIAARFGSLRIVSALLSDKYRNNSIHDSRDSVSSLKAYLVGAAVAWLAQSDTPVDPTIHRNLPIREAIENDHVDVVKLLLEDKRIDPSSNPEIIEKALKSENIEIIRLLLLDDRIVITNEILGIVDLHYSSARVDAFFTAAPPLICPNVFGNDVACVSRKHGHLRNKLDRFELMSSRILLLCVKHIFTPKVAARVGDVLRDVCSEWTRYESDQVKSLFDDDDEEEEEGDDDDGDENDLF